MKKPTTEAEVKTYYDNYIYRKIQDFIQGNARVERAWTTLNSWTRPKKPAKILELGCGIGQISFRASQHWPNAKILGIDISPNSIQVANRLFGSPRLLFQEGTLQTLSEDTSFDIILLIDVYEHISKEKRESLHRKLSTLLSEEGLLFLSFPTKKHQTWLKENKPEEIQPIDEIITLEELVILEKEVEITLACYQEVSVWHQGDYAHAVFTRSKQFVRKLSKKLDWLSKLSHSSLETNWRAKTLFRQQRRSRVLKKLGPEFLTKS